MANHFDNGKCKRDEKCLGKQEKKIKDGVLKDVIEYDTQTYPGTYGEQLIKLREELKKYRIKPELNKKIDYIMLSAAWRKGIQYAQGINGNLDDDKTFTLTYFKSMLNNMCNEKCSQFNLFSCTTPNMLVHMLDELKVPKNTGKFNGGDDHPEWAAGDEIKMKWAPKEWFETANMIDVDLYKTVSLDLFDPQNTKYKEIMPKAYQVN